MAYRGSIPMRWISKPADSEKMRVLSDALAAGQLMAHPASLPLLANLLVQRGIEDAESALSFLTPELSHLHDPVLMSGMAEALSRLEAAVERKEKVLIYGDYDVDGTTA